MIRHNISIIERETTRSKLVKLTCLDRSLTPPLKKGASIIVWYDNYLYEQTTVRYNSFFCNSSTYVLGWHENGHLRLEKHAWGGYVYSLKTWFMCGKPNLSR
jgi:hypothetical protein